MWRTGLEKEYSLLSEIDDFFSLFDTVGVLLGSFLGGDAPLPFLCHVRVRESGVGSFLRMVTPSLFFTSGCFLVGDCVQFSNREDPFSSSV